ncbi:MAG: DUF2383 domain-containing protein [Algicola sp.]|nr:DUF2383 domain-containing protein [Algicola sp.]
MKTSITYTVGSETLQKILMTSIKAKEAYRHLQEQTENPYIQKWLTTKLKSIDNFILEVQVHLETMGIEPVSISKMQLRIMKLMAELKSIMTRKDDEMVIRECLNIDGVYLSSLSNVKRSAVVTDTLYQLYSKQIEAIRRRPIKQMENHNVLLG